METPVIEQPTPTSGAESFAEHKALRAAPVETKAAPVKEEPKQEAKSTPEPEKGTTAETAGESETREAQEKAYKGRKLDAEAKIAENYSRWKDSEAKRQKVEAERDELRRELAAFKAPKPGDPKPAATLPATTEPDNPKPKLADFLAKNSTYEEGQEAWEEAVADWRDKKRQADTAKAEGQRQAAATRDTLGRKTADARTKYADFDEVTAGDINTGTGLILTPAMQQFVVESPSGMEVAYHLGKHPEECSRITALSPAMQLAELGWIAKQQSAPPEKPKTTPVSHAPPPPRTVGGTEPPRGGSTAEAQSFAEHKRLRRGGG